jgi:hypothetical protein
VEEDAALQQDGFPDFRRSIWNTYRKKSEAQNLLQIRTKKNNFV